MTSSKLNAPLPITLRTIHAISRKEPSSFLSCKGRSFSLINAVIYSFRVFVDPICSMCLIITHLFKSFYHIFSSFEANSLQKAKIEVLKTADFLLYAICSPIFNFALAGKCSLSIFNPAICYRPPTAKEQVIIKQFDKYKKESFALGCTAVKDLTNLNLKTRVTKKIDKLKRMSEATRIAYFKLKLYTV